MSLAQAKPEKLDEHALHDQFEKFPEWQHVGTKMIRSFKFKNFLEALAFVNKLAPVAEEANHHPDISFGWGYAEITLTTHDAGGLTQNDFLLAARIDKLA